MQSFHWYEQNYILDVKLPLDQTYKLENMSEQFAKCVGVLHVDHNITKEQKVSSNLKHKHCYQQFINLQQKLQQQYHI